MWVNRMLDRILIALTALTLMALVVGIIVEVMAWTF